MTADLIILPVVRSFKHSLDALEQRDREVSGFVANQRKAPPRTRPLLVVANDHPAAASGFFKSAAPVDMAGGKGRAPNAAGHSSSRKGRK